MDNKDIDNYTNEKNIEESQITLDKQADKNIEKVCMDISVGKLKM